MQPNTFQYVGGGTDPAQQLQAHAGDNGGKSWQSRAVGAVTDWWNKKNAPQIGANPYQGDWSNLVGQLQMQAAGNGPSLAGDAYKQAQQTGMNNVLAMSRSGTAGGTRGARQTIGTMNQGLQQGYANTRLQEQMAARQSLQMALAGAGNAWFQPQQANLQAQLGTQSNGQQLMGFASQLAGSIAPFATGGGGGGGGQQQWQGPPGGNGTQWG